MTPRNPLTTLRPKLRDGAPSAESARILAFNRISPTHGIGAGKASSHQALILDALKDARAAIGLAAPVRTLGKIDHAIALLERSGDCDRIDTATKVYGDGERA